RPDRRRPARLPAAPGGRRNKPSLRWINSGRPVCRNGPKRGGGQRQRRSAMTERGEPIHDVAHLGSVELLTPAPERSLWYFRDLLGMEPVHESGPSAYLRGYGDYATSTLKLTAAAD